MSYALCPRSLTALQDNLNDEPPNAFLCPVRAFREDAQRHLSNVLRCRRPPELHLISLLPLLVGCWRSWTRHSARYRAQQEGWQPRALSSIQWSCDEFPIDCWCLTRSGRRGWRGHRRRRGGDGDGVFESEAFSGADEDTAHGKASLTAALSAPTARHALPGLEALTGRWIHVARRRLRR